MFQIFSCMEKLKKSFQPNICKLEFILRLLFHRNFIKIKRFSFSGWYFCILNFKEKFRLENRKVEKNSIKHNIRSLFIKNSNIIFIFFSCSICSAKNNLCILKKLLITLKLTHNSCDWMPFGCFTNIFLLQFIIISKKIYWLQIITELMGLINQMNSKKSYRN